MAKCSLCGGDLGQNKRCTFCGLDNTKNDDMYKQLLNKNNCAHEPLTHVHTESKQRAVRSDKSKTTTQKSMAAKILSVIIIIVTLGGSVVELIDSLVPEDFGASYEETVNYDPYESVPYDLPETGMDYSIILQPGVYTVGTHIPEGTYEARVVTGDYGMIEINDYHNSIYLYENLGELDEQSMVGDLRLYKDGHFVVSNGIQVELVSNNVQSLELFKVENPLTEKFTLLDDVTEYVAGVDFPAGVYDISFVPVYSDEYGRIEYTIPMSDYDSEWAIIFGETGSAETYHNVVLPSGARIRLDGLQSVTLTPSVEIAPMNIDEFYQTF